MTTNRRIWKKRITEEWMIQAEKRGKMFDNHFSLSLFSSLFSRSLAFVLIIDHQLLFLFDQTISSPRRRRKMKNYSTKKTVKIFKWFLCGKRRSAMAGVEITIRLMNSIAVKYIQNGEERKNARTHVVYLTNVCSEYKQTKQRGKWWRGTKKWRIALCKLQKMSMS